MAKEARVYKIDYETEKTSWNSYIAAFSQEEAVRKLYDAMPRGSVKKIINTSQHCRLDAISTPLQNDINKPMNDKINELLGEIADLRKAKDLRTVPKK